MGNSKVQGQSIGSPTFAKDYKSAMWRAHYQDPSLTKLLIQNRNYSNVIEVLFPEDRFLVIMNPAKHESSA